MDLTAYSQIKDISEIAKKNNIEVPRLRGYRLMKNELPVTKEEIEKLAKDFSVRICEGLCTSRPYWDDNANCHELSWRTDHIVKYYIGTDKEGNEFIRWDRIHGWKRKRLKFAIKNQRRRIEKQFEVWNKYVGRDDVLYIHTRIGGLNWDYYGGDKLTKESWFLEKVDDWWDGTYCDIFAKIEK